MPNLAKLAHALCLALGRLNDAPVISSHVLAEAVSGQFPDVPAAALRVIAASVLRLHFECPTVADIKYAGLPLDDAIEAAEFFGAAHLGNADALEILNRRNGGNVVNLPKRT